MSTSTQDQSLKLIHRNILLQKRRREPGIRDLAVAIAQAAGYEVTPDDPIAHQAPAPSTGGVVSEEIDFDGDSFPDAIRVDGKWVLKP